MSNPYFITGPALISFSGGRTSAYMLRKILDAHDGRLPDDVFVTFANTGKEREETLRFVHDCETHWAVRVHWLEWRGEGQFEEVGYNSASRKGEPFAALIDRNRYLPTAITRFCTVELKIRTMSRFARTLGWKHWSNIVGLRYDEGHRVMKALARNDSGKERFKAVMPMSKAKATKADVMAFWARQPFDLQLKSYEGNCDLCFLKSKEKLKAIIRENPGIENWWVEQEKKVDDGERYKAGRFLMGHTSMASLAQGVADQGFLFNDDDEFDVECGLTCEPTE